MTTTTATAALVLAEPLFSGQERLALAGFLAGYSGLTRDAYALDLRQFSTWCHRQQLRLFAVRRADIELFARELENAGRRARLRSLEWRRRADRGNRRHNPRDASPRPALPVNARLWRDDSSCGHGRRRAGSPADASVAAQPARWTLIPY
jgi:hypothetical protein